MMPAALRRLLHGVLCVLAALAPPVGEAAGPSRVTVPAEWGGPFAVPVASLKDLHFLRTLRQRYDFSCGSAALATLLTYHYGFPVDEQEVFRAMYQQGDQTRIRKEGFSLLDIKNYLETHGFEADGFVADIDRLIAAATPAIVLIKENGYFHFVVVKGARGGRVLIGDPSNGARAMERKRFEELWVNRIVFVILNRQERARFNQAADWRAAPDAPLAQGVRDANPGMPMPKFGPADF